ncbi:MCE family protein [Nocardioides sp. NPDC101246]|uniref:MCE family protein n=1 Tax=Nocardioides sp. NPDC101246 TaxID=3364336 RepID=UPI003818845A
MTIPRLARSVAALAAVTVTASGCTWSGLNGISLPFTKGGGDDSYRVTVQLDNAANLVANSEVKYDEVTIGSVRKIELKDWTATLTIGIDGDAKIPDDVTAKVAQKSLLGAEYLALSDPEDASAAAGSSGYLASGDVIGLERTGRYPETEEVLAAGSMLLNGGGLPQIREISHELNAALGGREGDIKSFMRTSSRFTARLDGQRDNIATTLVQLDKLSRTVVEDEDKIDRALEEVPEGVELLERDRAQLVDALEAVDGFGKTADRVVGANKADLQTNLDNLRPVTGKLAKNSEVLARNADALGYPFMVRAGNRTIQGDYINLIAEIEVSAEHLARDWLGGTPLDGLFNGFLGAPVGTVDDTAGSLEGLLGNGTGGLLGGTGTEPGESALNPGAGDKESDDSGAKSHGTDSGSGLGGGLGGLLGGD